MVLKVYSIQVSGIKCTNCAGKIQRGLIDALSGETVKVSVNIIQQKINITLQNQLLLLTAISTLENLGYSVIGQPLMISGGDSSQRSVTFVYTLNSNTQKIQSKLAEMIGIIKINHSIEGDKIKLNITYNCQTIKGREIADFIAEVEPNFQIINQRVESFKGIDSVRKQKPNLIITGILCAFLLLFNMILPFTGEWYDSLIGFPSFLGIYTFSVLINIAIGIYVMLKYAKPFILRAYRNYTEFGQTNMQTLIALGSLSAFSLFLFFLIQYTIDYSNTTQMNRAHRIMQINDALTSASIIVLVVTIGKYYQDKIKRKIDQITADIFPQSTLFNNMIVQYVELQNRKLLIKEKKNYDVTLIQKSDILDLLPGRLLLDVIVLSGEIKATQSAINGSEDINTFMKGQRIQSGAIIHENNDSLVQVQNVFEQSILIQIGTQIKIAQNQQQSQQSGIQAVCKKISSYFVKFVIILSISVMVVWAFLLYIIEIEVPICKICWIVQRGIGILVASCPCALGLAVPSVIAIILNLATKSGILIRNNSIFEKMKNCNIISFDKTGTLFTRIQKIQQSIMLWKGIQESRMWEIIAILEKQIRHPLAEILYKQSFNRCKINGTNFNYLLLEKPSVQKEGIKAEIRDKETNENLTIRIGNKHLMINNEIMIPNFNKNQFASTELFLGINNKACLVMFLNTHSNLRPQAYDVVKLIQNEGKQVHILSGDSTESVEKLGDHLGIPRQCLHPQQSAFMKMDWIKGVQQDQKKGVLMVGDGLNDIPCLQEASIGISINAKSQLNINAASAVILSQNLYKILALIRMVNRGNLFIIINLFWAFAYNIAIMPLVAGVFYPLNVYVSPVWSSVAMSASSIIVVLFSQLLVCFNYDESLKKGEDQKKKLEEQISSLHEDDTIKKMLEMKSIEMTTSQTKGTRFYHNLIDETQKE